MDVGAQIQSDDDASEQSLAHWQATGQDAHSLSARPADLFANYLASDFHLRTSSPARDAGTASLAGFDAPELDCDGAPRPTAAAWDIGAYEFGSSVR